MTDKQFEKIKKGLQFYSEGGIDNLCTMTETALREIIEDAVKFYEKQQKIDAEQIRALQKQKGELTDQVYELKDRLNEEIELHQHAEDYIKSLEAQIEKMKKYIKACWHEERLNDYSSYITNTMDEFKDLVHELNEEIRNGR